MNCVIIGAGQLGSRHLQGLLNYKKSELNIFVVDPNEHSLEIAKSRASEVKSKHLIHYLFDMVDLPIQIKFAVVATNSIIRENITKTLLTKFTVDFLILEKILFPNLEAYSNIEKLLKEHINTKCFVNHPRRNFDSYISIKKILKDEKKLSFQVVGSNWGLACNGLHFIDVFEFISDSKLKNLDIKYLENKIIESKREGYVEITGSLVGSLANNNVFNLNSIFSQNTIPPQISIMGENKRILIQETGGNASFIVFDLKNNFLPEIKEFIVKFQSELTHLILEELLISGSCGLTPFLEASHTHTIFIDQILKFYNENKYTNNNKTLPIT